MAREVSAVIARLQVVEEEGEREMVKVPSSGHPRPLLLEVVKMIVGSSVALAAASAFVSIPICE